MGATHMFDVDQGNMLGFWDVVGVTPCVCPSLQAVPLPPGVQPMWGAPQGPVDVVEVGLRVTVQGGRLVAATWLDPVVATWGFMHQGMTPEDAVVAMRAVLAALLRGPVVTRWVAAALAWSTQVTGPATVTWAPVTQVRWVV